MKPLLIFGFALALGFLAPLAQAAPVPAAPPEHADYVAPAQPATDDRQANSAPPAAEQRDPGRAPHSDQGPDAPPQARPEPVRDHDRNSTAPDVTTAPDTDQGSAPACDNQTVAPTDDSGTEAVANPAHYTMDDLANAAASLDSPYDSTHFSMDDIGGL